MDILTILIFLWQSQYGRLFVGNWNDNDRYGEVIVTEVKKSIFEQQS